MYILNQYSIQANDTPTGAAVFASIAPNVVTGATGNSANGSSSTKIVANSVYMQPLISEILSIFIPTTGLTAAQDNYIYVPLDQLGITGVRAVRAAALLGIYNSASVEVLGGNGGTPSFIGMWDKTVASVNCLSIIKDHLVLAIPAAQIALFGDKETQIQIWYRTATSG